MLGANVTYTFQNGTTVQRGGSFDLHQVHALREILELRYEKRIVGTNAVWRRPWVGWRSTCPGCDGFSSRIHQQYCETPYQKVVASSRLGGKLE